ncbi:NAD(P)-dependent oxidoreductase [Salinarimonas ramus]|uniref:NADH-flavin reductase n=1 Tax=Salinarimonas ramus TaxID=690164 RepID=A0A917V6L1_9HYPH|nr:NAD(P)H-binding protein [Salinarimonas ramus]GGK46426.1 NADH-flavin reductase [Salinarimonas ramus]
MRLTIIGATRGIGKALCEQARAAGHHVTAVGRSLGPASSATLTHVRGSILDEGVAEEALEGADAVAYCLGAGAYGPDKGRPVTIFSETTERLMEAMRATGVMRIGVITGVGSGDSRGHGGVLYDTIAMPLALGAIYADKTRQEEMLRASDRDWTLIRPTVLTHGPYTGTYRVIEDLTGFRGGTVSRADCADCLLRALAEHRWSRRAVVVTGGDGR